MRLRVKLQIFLLSVSVVPIVGLMIIILAALYGLQDRLVADNTSMFRANLERTIEVKAQDIARQLELYLLSHPDTSLAELQQDQEFRRLALQPVGVTGYTAIHDSAGVNRFHRNREMENKDLLHSPGLRDSFVELYRRSLDGWPVSGYYRWIEGSREREKFMATAPIKGTDLILAATVYTDEFLHPAHQAADRISSTSSDLTRQVMLYAAVVVLIVLLVSGVMSNSLTRSLIPLLQGMRAFGAGNLEYRIQERGRDELALLGGVFNSMAGRLAEQTAQLQRRTDEAERSERNQHLLLENIYDLVVYLGMDGRIVRTSPRIQQVLGSEPGAIAGRHYSELVDLESLRWISLPGQVPDEAAPRVAEFIVRALHASGLWIELQVSAMLFHQPDLGDGAMLVCHDVSNERRLEQTIQLLSKAVEQSREGIALLGLDGRLLYSNQAWIALHGLSRPEGQIGRTLQEIRGGRSDGVAELIQRLLRRPRDWEGDVDYARAGGGGVFPAQLAVSTVRDETGRPTALMLTLRDVSERVLLDRELKKQTVNLEEVVRSRTEELARTNARLEQAMRKTLELDRLKSDFVANVSRQLRTPLNTIIGFSNLLLADQSLQTSQREDVQRIYSDARQLSGFISSILAMADIEAGQARLNPERFDLAESVRQMIESLAGRAAEKGLTLVDLVSGRDIEVQADKAKINQVLYTLLNNAVEFTEKGEIVVGVRTAEADWIALSVKDSGRGIAPDELETIFERFSKAALRSGGMGLGLPLAKALVEMHGGSIWAESDPGSGSTFYFRLPARLEQG